MKDENIRKQKRIHIEGNTKRYRERYKGRGRRE
jgi:hypothetical protein